jgi:uncharacterized protein GlcG (DUF336 family)
MTTPASTLPPDYDPALSLADAQRMLTAAIAEAERNHWPMVIAIVDSAARLTLLARMEHAQGGSIEVAQAKARTAVNFKRPTKAFEEAIAAGGKGLRTLAMPGVCPIEGGLPILRDGKVLGAIGVSGMRSDQDTVVALAGLAAL